MVSVLLYSVQQAFGAFERYLARKQQYQYQYQLELARLQKEVDSQLEILRNLLSQDRAFRDWMVIGGAGETRA